MYATPVIYPLSNVPAKVAVGADAQSDDALVEASVFACSAPARSAPLMSRAFDRHDAADLASAACSFSSAPSASSSTRYDCPASQWTSPIIEVRGLSKRYRLGTSAPPSCATPEAIGRASVGKITRRRRGSRRVSAEQSARCRTLFGRCRTFRLQLSREKSSASSAATARANPRCLKILSRITEPTPAARFCAAAWRRCWKSAPAFIPS